RRVIDIPRHGFLTDEGAAGKGHPAKALAPDLADEVLLTARAEPHDEDMATAVEHRLDHPGGLVTAEVAMLPAGDDQLRIASLQLAQKIAQLPGRGTQEEDPLAVQLGMAKHHRGNGGEVEADPADALPGQARHEIGHQHAVAEIVQAFLRSEEHTSELQSRENLVCRL